MKSIRILLSMALVLGAFTLNAQAQELLENGGFESALLAPDLSEEGNFSSFSGGPTQPFQDTVNPNTGLAHLTTVFAGEDNTFAGVQQTQGGIITGETYTFSLLAQAAGPLGFNVEFRLEYLDDLGGFVGGIFDNNVDITAGLNDTTYSFFTQSSIAPAGATQLRAVFAGQSFGGGDNTGTVFADDFSVTGVTIPEPASFGLLALGMVGFASRRRR